VNAIAGDEVRIGPHADPQVADARAHDPADADKRNSAARSSPSCSSSPIRPDAGRSAIEAQRDAQPAPVHAGS